MNRRRGGMIVLAFAAVAAIYYGLRTGPTQTSPSPSTSESASASVAASPSVADAGMPALPLETVASTGGVPTVDPSTKGPPPTIDPRCPAGQTFKEITIHGPGGGKGCVRRRADGSDSREGRWSVQLTGDRTMIGTFVDDKEEGRWTTWYDQGGKAEEMDYLHGIPDGLQIVWSKEGLKGAERHYTKGAIDGDVTIFRPDGRIIRQVWKNGVQIDPPPNEPPIEMKVTVPKHF
jgi:hypothetical protein